MVTKLKNFNKEILIKILTFGIIICSSVGMMSFYKNIEYTSSVNKNKFLNYDYLLGVIKKNDILYNNLQIGENNLGKYSSLDYVVFKINRKIYNNANNNYLKEISEKEYNSLSYSTKELKQNYQWYIVFSYDVSGNMKVLDVYGANEENTKEIVEQIKIDNYSQFNSNGKLAYSNISSTVIAYGLPKSLVNEYVYVGIFSIIIALSALIIPYKIEKSTIVLRKFNNISIKIKLLIYSIIISLESILSKKLIRATLYNSLIYDVKNYFGISYKKANFIVYTFNLIFWFILFLSIFLAVILLKEIIINFKENKEKYFKLIEDISLKKSFYRGILIIGIVNFLGVLFAYFLGILGVLIYSIIFFTVLLIVAIKIRKNYNLLVKYTKSLSEGNFNINIDVSKDLRPFNCLKEKLIKVKEGLKKAISEEVKSQNMKNELISNVSHDLKTPLTSIITYVDLLKQENITKEEQNKYINTIDKKAQRLKSLIEDLFEVSKANSGNIKLNLMDIDIVALIKQTEFELEDKIKESGLKFKNTFPKEKIILSLDSEKTYRIFENLIINALKYSLKGSRVYIVIEENNEEVSIVFKNISAEEIDFNPEEISERFVRGDKSRNTEGAGLGLAIAKSFTEVQKGKFKIEVDGYLFKVILKFKKNNNFVKEEEALDFKKAIL